MAQPAALVARNDRGFKQLESELPEDFEPLAREHKTLETQMRLAAPLLRSLVTRLADGDEVSPELWAGYDVVAVDASSFCGPGATTTEARVHLQLRLADLDTLAAPIEKAAIGESFERFSWSEGQLATGDRGYGNAPGAVRSRSRALPA